MTGMFEIVISPDGGSIKVDIGSITGTKCVDLSRVFTDLGNIETSEKKAEYYIPTEDAITVYG